jgi:hypothetical protein
MFGRIGCYPFGVDDEQAENAHLDFQVSRLGMVVGESPTRDNTLQSFMKHRVAICCPARA